MYWKIGSSRPNQTALEFHEKDTRPSSIFGYHDELELSRNVQLLSAPILGSEYYAMPTAILLCENDADQI
jgi:hypothetical protein